MGGSSTLGFLFEVLGAGCLAAGGLGEGHFEGEWLGGLLAEEEEMEGGCGVDLHLTGVTQRGCRRLARKRRSLDEALCLEL